MARDNGIDKVNLTTNGTYVFPQSLEDGLKYVITVDRQPSSPSQTCSLVNGSGEINNGPVTQVNVSCVDATKLTVTVDRAASDGAQVDVLLISKGSGAALKGKAPSGTKLTAGKANFVVAGLGGGDAQVPPGAYLLYVLVNHVTDFDPTTGQARYAAGDYGAFRTLDLSVTQTNLAAFTNSHLVELQAPAAAATGPLQSHDSMFCFWTPAGSGQFTPPKTSTSNVLAASSKVCDASGPTCLVTNANAVTTLTTDTTGPLPPSVTVDLTCWVDRDTNGSLSTGDLIGHSPNVGVGGALPISITLSTH